MVSVVANKWAPLRAVTRAWTEGKRVREEVREREREGKKDHISLNQPVSVLKHKKRWWSAVKPSLFFQPPNWPGVRANFQQTCSSMSGGRQHGCASWGGPQELNTPLKVFPLNPPWLWLNKHTIPRVFSCCLNTFLLVVCLLGLLGFCGASFYVQPGRRVVFFLGWSALRKVTCRFSVGP